MIDRISAVYVENNTKLSGPIGPGMVYTKIRQDNDITDHTDVVYTENETKL